MCALLPSWKTAHPWLSDAPSQALQQSLKDLERAFTNFFNKRADFPDFHKKGRKDSFRIPQGFEVDSSNGRISLPTARQEAGEVAAAAGSQEEILE